MLMPLKSYGGAAAKAAGELEVVLAGALNAASGTVAGGTAPLKALEDLQEGPGGRHDNDSTDFRCDQE